MTTKQEEIVKQIQNDWSTKLQSDICITILDYLSHYKNNNLSHITYASLHKVTGEKYSNKDLMMAI